MHPRSWLPVLILAAFAAQGADIYKWTDADGVVHYSDQPHPGAVKIAGTNSGSSISTYSGAEASQRAGVRQRVSPFLKIEVEVESVAAAAEAAAAGADLILLDNMSPALMAEAVRAVAGRGSSGQGPGSLRALARRRRAARRRR